MIFQLIAELLKINFSPFCTTVRYLFTPRICFLLLSKLNQFASEQPDSYICPNLNCTELAPYSILLFIQLSLFEWGELLFRARPPQIPGFSFSWEIPIPTSGILFRARSCASHTASGTTTTSCCTMVSSPRGTPTTILCFSNSPKKLQPGIARCPVAPPALINPPSLTKRFLQGVSFWVLPFQERGGHSNWCSLSRFFKGTLDWYKVPIPKVFVVYGLAKPHLCFFILFLFLFAAPHLFHRRASLAVTERHVAVGKLTRSLSRGAARRWHHGGSASPSPLFVCHLTAYQPIGRWRGDFESHHIINCECKLSF